MFYFLENVLNSFAVCSIFCPMDNRNFLLGSKHAMVQLVEVLALQAGKSRIRFPMGSLEFSLDLILQFYGPGVNSDTNRNE